jgi:peptide methionine sulfoxide reductase msrA/msrB
MLTFTNKYACATVIAAILVWTPLRADAQDTEIAYFAGGCFWCTEADFEKINGVQAVVSGFMGGSKPNPSYEDVAGGKTQHRETVKVVYDPALVSYQTLLSAFWRMHDPSDAGGSFVDRGRHYGSAIYARNAAQRKLAQGAVTALNAAQKFDRPVATEIADSTPFYSAEGYHQDYYLKNAVRYKYYRYRSGRDQFIDQHWRGDDTLYQAK